MEIEDISDEDITEENEEESGDENDGFGINADTLRNAPTCLVPEHLESAIIVNETGNDMTLEDAPTISVAPGEGKVPQTFLRDPHFEVKAFPRHFPSGKYGLHHEREVNLPANMYYSQRIMNKDDRFSKDLTYIFMASQFCERQALEKQINIAGLCKTSIKL